MKVRGYDEVSGAYQEEGAWGGVHVMHIEQVTGHRPEETKLLPLTGGQHELTQFEGLA